MATTLGNLIEDSLGQSDVRRGRVNLTVGHLVRRDRDLSTLFSPRESVLKTPVDDEHLPALQRLVGKAIRRVQAEKESGPKLPVGI